MICRLEYSTDSQNVTFYSSQTTTTKREEFLAEGRKTSRIPEGGVWLVAMSFKAPLFFRCDVLIGRGRERELCIYLVPIHETERENPWVCADGA